MKHILSIIFFFLSCSSQAQVFTEKVYLSDSVTVYEGLIIEQAPARYIRIIRKKEMDTIQVMLKDIWKLTKEYPKQDTTQPVLKSVKPVMKKTARSIYLEVLGAGGIYSFNYDVRLNKGKQNGWGIRAGIEYYNLKTLNYYNDTMVFHLLGIPVMVNYLYGKKKGKLEVGAGVTYFASFEDKKLTSEKYQYTYPRLGIQVPVIWGTFSVGYRYAPPGKGFTFGVSLNPVIGSRYWFPSAGLKLGYKFS